jgi:hypothetical protein
MMKGQKKEVSSLCSREKYWDELTSDEKIERLGRQVEQMSRALNNDRRMNEFLRRHHHLNGKMVVEMDGGYNQAEGVFRDAGPLNREPVLVKR